MKVPTNLASLRIMSLASGFPEPKRSKRWILMLQAFVDECAGQNGAVFVMAGYVAPLENWLAFSDEWQKVLDLHEHPHRPMEKAKMSKMRHPRGLRRAELFYRVIEKHVTAAFSCTIDVVGMKEALTEINWPTWVKEPEKLSNPYYFAFQAIAEGLAQTQEHFKLFEPVDFVFDEISCKAPCIKAWEDIKRYSLPEVRKYLGNTPIFRPEEEYLPLQAADLYAYWVHRWTLTGSDSGLSNLDFPWKTNRNMLRVHKKFGRDDFLKEWRKGLLVHQVRAAGGIYAHCVYDFAEALQAALSARSKKAR